MKKLLRLIGALTLIGTASAPVIACGSKATRNKNTDKAHADAIKNKITDADLTVPVGTDHSTSNPQTITAIKIVLKTDNPSLTIDDLHKITFNNTTLVAGQAKAVTATITVGTATANKTLNVTLPQTDQQKANAIKNKITDVNLILPPRTNPSTANPRTVTAIKTKLKTDNTSLTDDDVAKITFEDVNLVPGQAINVTATITVGTATATKSLNVKLLQTDRQKANAIKNKITNTALTVPKETNPSTANPQTITAIKNALKKNNTSLTADDLLKISFNTVTLVAGQAIAVTATITVGTATASKTLNVTLEQTDQQRVNAIKAKITDVNLTLARGTNPSTTNPQTVTAIKTALKADNNTLTVTDLQNITFNTVTLILGQSTNVTATITVGTATGTKTLNITLAQTDAQNADAIKNKITDVDLTVPAGTNPSTGDSGTVLAIKTALKADNNTLTVTDLQNITFNTVTLVARQAIAVTATITVGQATATKNLNVTLAQTDQQKANAIKDKITDHDLTVSAGTNPSTTNPQTVIAIKTALKTDNQTLTGTAAGATGDLSKISFSRAPLVAGQSTQVTAIITVGTANAIENLNVTLPRTDGQKADVIKNKITDVDLTVAAGTGPSTGNAGTIMAIKTALKADNPSLTGTAAGATGDLSKIGFNTVMLVAGQATNVTATITVGLATATKTLNVTLAQTDQQKANAIRDKITDNALTIPAGTNPSTGNNQTIQAIKTALKTDNTSLTTVDLATITFNTVTLVAGQATNVTATITVGSATVNSTLNVTLPRTDQQKADVIKNKITDTALTIPAGIDPSTTHPQTVTAIKNALGTDNTTLTTADLAKITFNSVTLVAGTATNVTATITVGSATANKTLNVTLPRTDQQKANAIKNKITDVNLVVPGGTNPSTANPQTVTAIKNVLKTDNTTLNTADLAKITFNTVSLLFNQVTNVIATITVGTATTTQTLNITLARRTWTQSTSLPANLGGYAAPVKIGSTYYLSSDSGQGIYTSTDGSTWTRAAASGIPTDTQSRVAPVKIGSTYYLSTDGKGLYTSANGSTWTRAAASGIPTNARSYDAPVKIGSTYYLSTNGSGLYTSANGSTWNRAAASGIPTNAAASSAPVKIGSKFYFATNGNGLYTSDDGITWNRNAAVGLETNFNFSSQPVKIGDTYFLGSYLNGFYISTNGSTWIKALGVPTATDIYSQPVKIGSTYYLSTIGSGLYTSTNGLTWTRSAATGIPTNARIRFSAVKIDSTYYISTRVNGLYASTDGITWGRSLIIPALAAPVKIDNKYFFMTLGNGLYTS